METKNKLQLSNPFYTISGKKERETLEKDLKIIKEKELIDRFIRRRIVFFMDGYRYATKAVGRRWGIQVSFFESGHDQIKKAYTSKHLEPEAAEIWWGMMDKDKNFSKKLIQELLNIIVWEKKLAKTIPQRELSKEEIEKYLLMHLDWWISFFEVAYLWFCTDNIKERIDQELLKSWKPFLYKGKLISAKEFIESVYRPMKFPMSSIEQRDLLKIAKLQGKAQGKALQEHIQKYHHLSHHNIDDEYFNEDYYKSRIKALQDTQEYENQKKALDTADQELMHANELLKAAPLPEWLKDRIEFVRWFMYLRTESVDHYMLVNASYKPVFQSFSKLFGLSMDQALHMTYEEIISSVRKGALSIPKALIQDRTHNGYAYLISVNGDYLVTGNEIDELQKLVVGEQKEKDIQEFKGQVAYPGTAKGKARVILDRRFAHELQEGEILVTTMTSPEFVPSMKRASAIITNEGGILCHAAIMSRELRKPCVIGTKTATDVIKTGDLIEVDANNGIVKILKKTS